MFLSSRKRNGGEFQFAKKEKKKGRNGVAFGVHKAERRERRKGGVRRGVFPANINLKPLFDASLELLTRTPCCL